MSELDFSDVMLAPDVGVFITIQRRKETISNKGRASETLQTFDRVPAVVIAEGGDLITNPDERHMPDVIHVHTQFRLRGTGPGYQPDLILWGGSRYVVAKMNDYSHLGGGFVSADCNSIEAQDAPA